jgi:hypothetical protein
MNTYGDGATREPMDLYLRLGLDGPTDRAALLAALDSRAADPNVRQIAAFVFHDDQRRHEHDNWWRTLSAVSMLRAQLGLSATVHWSRQPHGDFSRINPTEARMREAVPGGRRSINPDEQRR